jgi:hypothetical protein
LVCGFYEALTLEFAWFACAGGRGCGLATGRWVRIQQIDDVLQAEAIVFQKLAQLRFELDFFLQSIITFQCFQCLELLCKMFFQLTVFCEFGHFCSLAL